MILLTKDNSASPDAYSTDSGTDPVDVSIVIDGADGTESPVTPLYVWANDDTGLIDNYASVIVSSSGIDAGISWEFSLDGLTNWGSSILVGTLDVSSTYQAVQIYARATATEGVVNGNYETADIVISASQNESTESIYMPVIVDGIWIDAALWDDTKLWNDGA